MNRIIVIVVAMMSLRCLAGTEERGVAAFDFCGISEAMCNVSNYDASVSGNDLSLDCQRFITDAAQLNAKGFSHVFQSCLAMSEFQAGRGDEKSYCRYMDTVGELLRFLLENSRVFGKSVFDGCFAMTGNSLARIVNGRYGRKAVLTASDIKRWLPIIENRCDRDSDCLNRFRSLLVLGAAIEQYRREHGQLPEGVLGLADDNRFGIVPSDLSFCGDEIEYRKELDFWKLRIGRGKRKTEEPIFDYVPAAYRVAGLFVDEVWFASTYSLKRQELFANGFLWSDDVDCRCRLKGCVVIRGEAR